MFKNNYRKVSAFTISLLILLVLPMCFVLADPPASSPTTIPNPLGPNNTEVENLLVDFMNLVATAGAIVVVFFIIFSGYKFVEARGNETKINSAKDMFYWTVIGGAILLGADVIANVVVNTINATVQN